MGRPSCSLFKKNQTRKHFTPYKTQNDYITFPERNKYYLNYETNDLYANHFTLTNFMNLYFSCKRPMESSNICKIV